MARSVIVERLSGHRELVPLIASWFQAEWPDWYGTSGKGSAHDDVLKYASAGGAIARA